MAPPMMGGGPGRGRQAANAGKPKNTKKTLKRLLSYLGESRLSIAVAFLCVLISAGANLAGSYMLRPIINNYIIPEGGQGDPAGLLRGLLAMGLVYLAGVVCTYWQNMLMIRVSQKALLKIRNQLFEKMQTLPIRFFDTHTTGELMSRYTNDVDTVGEMLNSTLLQMFSGIISLVGTLSLMIYTNIYLTAVTVVMIPLFGFVAGQIAKHSGKYFREQQAALGELNG